MTEGHEIGGNFLRDGASTGAICPLCEIEMVVLGRDHPPPLSPSSSPQHPPPLLHLRNPGYWHPSAPAPATLLCSFIPASRCSQPSPDSTGGSGRHKSSLPVFCPPPPRPSTSTKQVGVPLRRPIPGDSPREAVKRRLGKQQTLLQA